MPDSARQAQANSFGAAAGQYEHARPSYPVAAVDWLLEDAGRRVLDLGAGTGKLTRRLLDRGLDVVAVDPSEGMLAELHRVLPEVRALHGTAESIPLPDGAVDVVLMAQAWHWVDVARAVPEVARVLSPGGRLGLVWNIRDERSDWVRELGAIMHDGRGNQDAGKNPSVGPPFGPIERFDVEWTYHLTRAALLDLVASRSYVITAPPADRAEIISATQELMDTHPALAGTADIALPYVTQCSRAQLR